MIIFSSKKVILFIILIVNPATLATVLDEKNHLIINRQFSANIYQDKSEYFRTFELDYSLFLIPFPPGLNDIADESTRHECYLIAQEILQEHNEHIQKELSSCCYEEDNSGLRYKRLAPLIIGFIILSILGTVGVTAAGGTLLAINFLVSLHIRRVSHLLHDIRNRSCKTVKSGNSQKVKEAAARAIIWNPALNNMSMEDQLDTIEKSVLVNLEDGIEEKDIHDIELEKMNATILFESMEEQNEKGEEPISSEDGENPIKVAQKRDEPYFGTKPSDIADEDFIPVEPGFFGGPVTRRSCFYYLNPPSEKWCRNVCIKLGLSFKQFLHPSLNGRKQPIIIEHCKIIDFLQVRGDGNCGYRALVMLLTGCDDQHPLMRHILCKYILEDRINSNRLEGVYPNMIEEVTAKIRVAPSAAFPELWLGEGDLAFFSRLVECNIIVYSSENGKCILHNHYQFGGPFGTQDPNLPTLLLRYSPGHYCPLFDVK